MAANRKLQAEIERTLKKVGEGKEKFEEIWQKLHNATNANQKEKYEEDLKKEIKKLQRLRDQIKTWMASPAITDKSMLVDNRKMIEQLMERFKVVERETKTKAYSKEGLTSGVKMDPAEKERCDTSQWLNGCLDNLNIQIDQLEAEMESMGTTNKKKRGRNNNNAESLDEIQTIVDKHRDHVQKLETLLRMLDNDTVKIEQIKDIKEDVEYYIENCRDPDFTENDMIYDDIEGLEDMLLEVTSVGGLSTQLASSSATSHHHSQQQQHSSSSHHADHVGHHHSGLANSMDAGDGLAVNESSMALNHSNHEQSPPNSGDNNNNNNNAKNTNSNTEKRGRHKSAASDENNVSSKSSSSGSHSSGRHTMAPSAVTSSVSLTANTTTTTLTTSTSSGTNSSNSVSSVATSVMPSLTLSSISSLTTRHSAVTSSGGQVSGQLPKQQHLVNSSSTPNNSSPSSGSHTVTTIANSLQQSGSSSNTTNSAPSSAVIGGAMSGQPNFAAAVQQMNGYASSLCESNGGQKSSSSSPIVLPNARQTAKLDVVNSPDVLPSKPESVESSLPSLKSMAQEALALSQAGSDAKTPTNMGGFSSSSQTSANVPGLFPKDGSGIKPSTTSRTSALVGSAHIPPLLGVAPLGPVPLTKETRFQYDMLASAFDHMPHPSDSERLRPYLPRNPCPTPLYYPQAPPNGSDSLDFFSRLSTETLFFIFYYMEGTQAQFLAARALKKQSWRFHTKYMMWFQRHEEPKIINDEFEQGTYIYFDFEKWGQRKKEGFTFEYRFLEDRDLV